jgi:hypothetical protein
MAENKISELIDKLRALRTEEDRIIALIEKEVVSTTDSTNDNNTGNTVDVVPPEDTRAHDRAFRRGDRVLITNLPSQKSLGLGFSRPTTEQDRHATVIGVSTSRVSLLTDNNDRIWRAPKNLLHL